MASFEVALAFTAKWEGGLTDHPADPGLITKYGVSLRWLRSMGHDVGDIDGDGDIDADDVRALTFDQAKNLFRARFWAAYDLDKLPQIVATCHYDCTVNVGPKQATLLTQRACNSIIGPYDVRLGEDGLFGNNTRGFLAMHSTPTLILAMMDQREAFYNRLAVQRPELKVFLRGWLNRCTDLRRFLGVAG